MTQTHQHHIIPRSQGGTNNPENLIELGFIEHAELHGREFLAGGPWFDFRHEGWNYLSRELRQEILTETSRRRTETQMGENNPMFGKKRLDRSLDWQGDNNPSRKPEARERLQRNWKDNLGPMFGENNPFFGKTHTEEVKDRLRISAKQQFPNGPMNGRNHTEETKQSMRGPREKMKGRLHWVNEQGKTCRSIESPGPEWQRGRKWRTQ